MGMENVFCDMDFAILSDINSQFSLIKQLIIHKTLFFIRQKKLLFRSVAGRELMKSNGKSLGTLLRGIIHRQMEKRVYFSAH